MAIIERVNGGTVTGSYKCNYNRLESYFLVPKKCSASSKKQCYPTVRSRSMAIASSYVLAHLDLGPSQWSGLYEPAMTNISSTQPDCKITAGQWPYSEQNF